jgi:transcriptional regulator with XRE-family HTH domain
VSRPSSLDGLGRVLRDLRIERGLTQVELAQGAGVSKSMLSLYEGEKQRPQLDTLEKLLDALGVRLGELAARLESRPTEQTVDSKRRGPRRSRSGVSEASGLEAEASGLEAEAAAAATQVLRGIGILLRIAARGANRVAAAPPEGPTRGPIG